MAIAVTLREFNDLERSGGDPIFISIVNFLYRFPTFCEKMKKTDLSSGSFNLLQNAPSNSVHLTSLFTCVAVSNAFLSVTVCENDDNI